MKWQLRDIVIGCFLLVLILLPIAIYVITSPSNIFTRRIGVNYDATGVNYPNGKLMNKFQSDTTVDYMIYGRFLTREYEDADGIHATFEVRTPTQRTRLPILVKKQGSHYVLYYSSQDFEGINFVGQVDGTIIQKMAIDGSPFVGVHVRFNPSSLTDEDKKIMQSLNTLNADTWIPPKGVTVIADAVAVVARSPTQ